MTYNIVVGRNEADVKNLKEVGTINIGKLFVRMGQTTSLSNNILLDIAKTHVIMIAGKRGSGKSFSASVMGEEVTKLPEEIRSNLSFLYFDTMGVFWTMKYPNKRQEEILHQWGMEPEATKIRLLVPRGLFDKYTELGINPDIPFAIKTSEMGADDWAGVFDVKLTDNIGILIERVINSLREREEDYSIDDITKAIELDHRSAKEAKDAAINRFISASAWGVFHK